MFRRFYQVENDPFNLCHLRTVANTPKRDYNCAGYALGIFAWYCPHDEDNDWNQGWGDVLDSEEDAMEKTMYAVNTMIKDFRGRLRMIDTMEQLDKKTERVVAFRISSDGDFHYIKKGANGHWYHKMGASRWIYEMSENEVFHSYWCDRYDGPLVLLAIKK